MPVECIYGIADVHLMTRTKLNKRQKAHKMIKNNEKLLGHGIFIHGQGSKE